MANYTLQGIFQLMRVSVNNFLENNSLRLAAALAYNAIFSIPPLLLIVIKAAGFFFGEQAVSGKLEDQVSQAISPDAASQVQTMVQNASTQESTGWAMWVGIGTLIFASTTFFVTLQQSLNSVWDIKVKPTSSIMRMAKERLFSFGLILSIALLMLISFIISAAVSVLSDYLSELLPGIGVWVIKLLDFAISIGLITLLFALIYKYLPDAHIRWKDTLIGALITAILFTIGKFLISWYIGTSDPGSAYGAAGSIILILVWIYYSSMIVFYGAEVTQQYARKFGQKISPKAHAVFVEEREITDKPKDREGTGRPRAEGRYEG
ncbi:YihY/virulence factor BrkB family protein [Pontibacter anaerobius]|uniref:YihY/virulence factor BrkB family protein n=1 Tax=Pontibacter anaerobius TaxID=2993940 RepID=A0ABT3RJD1_9BACT|nr:YihY/virulence factor BrkB family protein [Pontibacter anaerobius]MCX2741968.1 YihY/virulence factor BrkB family protein [Pontibacter anaerobius]